MRLRHRSDNLSRLFLPGLLILFVASCGQRCGSKPPASNKPQFARPLVDLVPSDALACVSIDNLKKVQGPIVELVRRIVPQDADQLFVVVRRLSSIDLTGKGFEPTGIRPEKGATLFATSQRLVLMLSISDRGKFEKALAHFTRTRGYRRWVKAPDGSHLRLLGRGEKPHLLATLSYHRDVALMAMPTSDKASSLHGDALVAPASALGAFRTGGLWSRVPAAPSGLRFALRSGGPVPEIVAKMLEGTTGALHLAPDRVRLNVRLHVKSLLASDLRSWFRVSSAPIAVERIASVSAPLHMVANLDFSQFSTIVSVLRLIGIDLVSPLRAVWAKDEHLDLASDLFRLLSGRAALFVRGLSIKLEDDPRRADDFPFVTWLRHTKFAAALQVTNPKRVQSLLDLATRMVTPPAKAGVLMQPARPMLALLREQKLRLVRDKRNGRDFYRVTSLDARSTYGSLTLRDELLWLSVSPKILDEALLGFYKRSPVKPSARQAERLSPNLLLGGLLDIKNLIQQLIAGGVPPGALTTVRRIRAAGVAIRAKKAHLELDLDISL